MKAEPAHRRPSPALRYALTVLAGVTVGVVAYQLWKLPTRHLAAVVVGLALVSLSTLLLKHLADFLLIGFFASMPLAGFVKTFLFKSWNVDDSHKAIIRYSGVIGVGLPELLLGALYLVWLGEILVTRAVPAPRLQKSDVFPLLLILAYVLSIPGTPELRPAVFATVYLVRFVAIYFYVSRRLELRHLPWVLLVLGATIGAESGLAMFQYLTGKLVSLAWATGQGEAANAQQYLVPGIEHISRATGTAYESHTFGLYMGMLTQFAFVFAFARSQPPAIRWFSGVALCLAVVALVLSFSRSAWLSCAIALAIGWSVHLYWQEREILMPAMLGAVFLVLISPLIIPLILERFLSAEREILTTRFEQYPIAWAIWRDHFLFGYGVGNYMKALDTYNVGGALALPVHNVLLWVAAESGLLGVVAFFGMKISALLRAWRVLRGHREPTCRIALAVFCAITVYLLDGLTDPLFREPVAYMMFWTCIAMSVAVVRMDRELLSPPVHAAGTVAVRSGPAF